MLQKAKITLTQRTMRQKRVRKHIMAQSSRPRLSVHRSLRFISGQVIDDTSGRTVAAIHSRTLQLKGKKVEVAFEVGKALGKLMMEKGIKAVVFDRGSNKYHGRVKAFASGVREAGVSF